MYFAGIRTLQVRNPDKTHAVLRRRAAKAGISLQEYLLMTLNELAERPTVREVLEPWAESRHRTTLEPRAGFTARPIGQSGLRT